jgi:tartrate dehydrogenase/decarboxylase/D-malate dehydrogenase
MLVLVVSKVMWDEILQEIAPLYPDIAYEQQHIDALCMNFVRHPQEFDVVVASNLFGDILTDLSGACTGSIGLNPSANLNPERIHPSLFEPVHGSAPDIDGKNLANPMGAVLSAAMMLEWLKAPPAAVQEIRDAVDNTLASGAATRDIGGNMTTDQITAALLLHL